MNPIGSSAPRLVGAAGGLVLDRLLGEPPLAVHPVARFGQVMAALERRTYRDARLPGVLHAAIGVGAAAAAGWGLDGALRRLLGPRVGRAMATALATGVAVAGRMLDDVASDIGSALADGDLTRARELLPSLVGRDPSGLDGGEIARAVVESVAENTVDAVIAPVFWAALGGAPAVLAHRAANTLDAMVGHRSPRYERFGWASARLDDVANYLPARLAALLTAVVTVVVTPLVTAPGSDAATMTSPTGRAARREILRAVREDAPGHPSPNAGVVEAAFAAALGVQLGGVNRYGDRTEDRARLGRGRAPRATDIATAVGLAQRLAAALAGGLTLAALGLRAVGRVHRAERGSRRT